MDHQAGDVPPIFDGFAGKADIVGWLRVMADPPFSRVQVQGRDPAGRVRDGFENIAGVGGVGLPANEIDLADAEGAGPGAGRSATGIGRDQREGIPAAGRNVHHLPDEAVGHHPLELAASARLARGTGIPGRLRADGGNEDADRHLADQRRARLDFHRRPAVALVGPFVGMAQGLHAAPLNDLKRLRADNFQR